LSFETSRALKKLYAVYIDVNLCAKGVFITS